MNLITFSAERVKILHQDSTLIHERLHVQNPISLSVRALNIMNGRSELHTTKSYEAQERVSFNGAVHVALTYSLLDVANAVSRVKSPKAGAVAVFAGTTRDNFNGRDVESLTYTSYIPLALKTMLSIAEAIITEHSLTAVSIVHRLGVVPIAEESIVIACSSPHRQAAWHAGEEILERIKDRVEIWKYEKFKDGGSFEGKDGQGEEGQWKENRRTDGKGREIELDV